MAKVGFEMERVVILSRLSVGTIPSLVDKGWGVDVTFGERTDSHF
jgi:hypothetical protein